MEDEATPASMAADLFGKRGRRFPASPCRSPPSAPNLKKSYQDGKAAGKRVCAEQREWCDEGHVPPRMGGDLE